MQKQSRRDVLKVLGAAPLAASAATVVGAQTPQSRPVAPAAKTQLCLVSRHLQWTDVEQGAAAAAEGGCTAVAWSVRGGAHILAENVERELPRAVAAAKKAGLATPI